MNFSIPWGFRVEGFIVKKYVIEKSGVEKSGVEIGVEKSGIEMSYNWMKCNNIIFGQNLTILVIVLGKTNLRFVSSNRSTNYTT